jgi:lipoyl(octanoyl) transferase
LNLESFKKHLSEKYFFKDNEISLRNEFQLVIEKFNWNYEEALVFQNECVEFVLNNDHYMVFIFCSHPHCFTMGRGLQKLKDTSTTELIEFNPDHTDVLSVPVYEIKRGGGLTFHYPGQLVFYPILKTTKYNFKVHDLMIAILCAVKNCLEEYFPEDKLIVNKELLGLWVNNQFKLASIGLAVNRFVTYHGLALNIKFDEFMFTELQKVYPCGLPGNLYKTVDNFVQNLNQDELEKNIKLELYAMIDKHISSEPIFDSISATESFKKVEDIISKTDLSLS